MSCKPVPGFVASRCMSSQACAWLLSTGSVASVHRGNLFCFAREISKNFYSIVSIIALSCFEKCGPVKLLHVGDQAKCQLTHTRSCNELLPPVRHIPTRVLCKEGRAMKVASHHHALCSPALVRGHALRAHNQHKQVLGMALVPAPVLQREMRCRRCALVTFSALPHCRLGLVHIA